MGKISNENGAVLICDTKIEIKKEEMTMNMLLELFLCFAKIGLFTFGGGYAMIAIIENTCVEQKKWLTHEEMMDIAVIAESTPGPIAINTATHVGFQRAGVIGALAATVGMVLPSFTIIFLISMCLEQFMEFTLIANAFQGIKVGVGLLIFDAGLKMMKKMPAKKLSRGLLLFGLAAMLGINFFSIGISSVMVMLVAAVVSLSLYFVKGGRKA